MGKRTDRQEFIVARIPEMRQEIRLGERKRFLPPTHADGRPVNPRLSTWASLAELTDRSVPFLSFIANNLLCWNSEGGSIARPSVRHLPPLPLPHHGVTTSEVPNNSKTASSSLLLSLHTAVYKKYSSKCICMCNTSATKTRLRLAYLPVAKTAKLGSTCTQKVDVAFTQTLYYSRANLHIVFRENFRYLCQR